MNEDNHLKKEEPEDDEEEEEEEGENSDDEDEEPKLKYHRLGASISDILKRDAASCMVLHERFLVGMNKKIY